MSDSNTPAPEPPKGPSGDKGSQARLDPFAVPAVSTTSRHWLRATGLQALLTCGLLAWAWYVEGKQWERHAQLIVIIGIVATWSLALRTIREQLLELMRYWQKASRGLLKKASDSGRHFISVRISEGQKKNIEKAVWRLRIIAAGLTIPFFVMPMLWFFISVVFSLKLGPLPLKDYWAMVAFFTMLSAFIVAGYFHWAIVPLPTPVKVSSKRSAPGKK